MGGGGERRGGGERVGRRWRTRRGTHARVRRRQGEAGARCAPKHTFPGAAEAHREQHGAERRDQRARSVPKAHRGSVSALKVLKSRQSPAREGTELRNTKRHSLTGASSALARPAAHTQRAKGTARPILAMRRAPKMALCRDPRSVLLLALALAVLARGAVAAPPGLERVNGDVWPTIHTAQGQAANVLPLGPQADADVGDQWTALTGPEGLAVLDRTGDVPWIAGFFDAEGYGARVRLSLFLLSTHVEHVLTLLAPPTGQSGSATVTPPARPP